MSNQKARRILFDESHGERGRLSLDFSQLAGLLRRNGFRTEVFQGQIQDLSLEQLIKISIIVMIAPSNTLVNKPVLARILRFVELGGGLILLADGGGDRALKTNISQLSQYFGVAFNFDHVRQKKGFMGGDSIISVASQGLDSHIINQGISELTYVRGCSLRINKTPHLVLRSSRYLLPPNRPLIVTSQYGQGRAFFSGSYQMFQDGAKEGITSGSNSQFALNVFNWVCGTSQLRGSQTESMKVNQELQSQPVFKVQAEKGDSLSMKKSLISTKDNFHQQMNALGTRIKYLETKIENGFQETRSLIEKLSEKISIAIGTKTESDFASDDENELSGITSYEAQKYRNDAINEKQSLEELMDYITQRRDAGALTEKEYEAQQRTLIEKIRNVETRISQYSQIIARANP
jgi:hypothetical protein